MRLFHAAFPLTQMFKIGSVTANQRHVFAGFFLAGAMYITSKNRNATAHKNVLRVGIYRKFPPP